MSTTQINRGQVLSNSAFTLRGLVLGADGVTPITQNEFNTVDAAAFTSITGEGTELDIDSDCISDTLLPWNNVDAPNGYNFTYVMPSDVLTDRDTRYWIVFTFTPTESTAWKLVWELKTLNTP